MTVKSIKTVSKRALFLGLALLLCLNCLMTGNAGAGLMRAGAAQPEATATTVAWDGLTGGAGTSFDAGTLTFGGSIDYYNADPGLGRTAGHRVGVVVTAPDGLTHEQAAGAKLTIGAREYTDGSFLDSGAGDTAFFYYYPLVTSPGQEFPFTIDWLNDGLGETITLRISPDAVLNKSASLVERDAANTGGATLAFGYDNTVGAYVFDGQIEYYTAASSPAGAAGNFAGVKISAPGGLTNEDASQAELDVGSDHFTAGSFLDSGFGETAFFNYYIPVTAPGQTTKLTIDWLGDGASETVTVKISDASTLEEEVKVASIEIVQPAASDGYYTGTGYQFTANVLPADADNKTLVWSVEGNATINASSGYLEISETAANDDAITVTATAADGSGVSASVTIHVNVPAVGDGDYTIEGTRGANNWYTSDVKIKPAGDYKYINEKEGGYADGKWYDFLSFSSSTTCTFKVRVGVWGSRTTGEKTVTVKIDKNKPQIDSIIKDPLTPTNSQVEVAINATDSISGIAFYSFDGGTTWQAGNTHAFGANGTYTVAVKDNAGLVSTTQQVSITNIDKSIPVIAVMYDNNMPWNTNYYKDARTAEITITEKNFEAQDVNITVTKDGAPLVISAALSAWMTDGDTHTATLAFPADGLYTFSIAYSDTTGNEAVPFEDSFTIDRTDPVITVAYENYNNTATSPAYFNDKRTATFTVVERNFDSESVAVAITAKDLAGNPFKPPAVSAWSSQGDTHTAVVEFNFDAQYTFNITCTDKSGRSTEKDDTFTVDTVPPANLKIQYDSNPVKEFLNAITFNLLFRDSVTVTVYADDITAGLEKIDYYYDLAPAVSAFNEGGSGILSDFTLNGYQHSASFKIEKQFIGYVSATATDKAGNSTEKKTDEGIVVDTISSSRKVTYAPVAQIVAPDTLQTQTEYSEGSDSVLFFAGDITATFNVDSKRFDKETIAITVSKDGGAPYTAAPADWARMSEDEGTPEYNIWTGTVAIPGPANHSGDGTYVLTVTGKDIYDDDVLTYTSNKLVIDTTKPVIDVTYDNNDALNGKYFKADRTATIKVTERNFRADDIAALVTAADFTGSPVTVDNYAGYLANPDNWVKNGDEYTATITYSVDANYTFDISYSDLAKQGDEGVNYGESVAPADFVVDHAPAANLKIQYNSDPVKEFLNTLTFDLFFKETVTVTLYADDATSGLDNVAYTYDVAADESVLNTGGYGALTAFVIDGYTHSASFDIAPQYKGQVAAVMTDKAGNSTDKVTDEGITVDSISPTRTVSYSPPVQIVAQDTLLTQTGYSEGSGSILFYTGDITATFTINEANFHSKDVNITVSKDGGNPNKLEPAAWARTGAQGTPEYDIWTGTITIPGPADHSGDGVYMIYMTYKDKSTKEMASYTSESLVIDTTKPVIDVTYDNNDALNSKYFKANRTATIKVTERNFRADDIAAQVTAADFTGSPVAVDNYAGYLADRANWVKNGDEYTATITYSADARYTFGIAYEDLAILGNAAVNYGASVSPSDFVVDHAPATNLKIQYNDNPVKDFLNTLTFNLFFQETVTVTVYADDVTSGLDYVAYNYDVADASSVKNAGGSGTLTEFTVNGYTHSASFDIAPQYKGQVEAAMTDKAGNVTGARDEGIVVDNISPTRSVAYSAPVQIVAQDTLLTQTEYSEGSGSILYYTGNVTATFTIDEANFYPGDVSITVSKDGGAPYAAAPADWARTGAQGTPEYDVWTGTYTIPGPADHSGDGSYLIMMAYTDRSVKAMPSFTSEELVIDTTKPVIDVTYDNNDALNGKYFKANRTATIKVTERNFRADDIAAQVTAADFTGIPVTVDNYAGYLADRANWVKNGDEYTATITYSADARYTFGIAYEDLAILGNAAVNYGASVSPSDFVVDHAPAANLKIQYNDNPVKEFLNTLTFNLFFKETVTVTLYADDFTAGLDNMAYTYGVADASSVKNAGGSGTLTEFTVNGYTHSASFDIAPQYKGQVEAAMTDKAGNLSGAKDEGIDVDSIAPTRLVAYNPVQIVDANTFLTKTDYPEGTGKILYFNGNIVATFTVDEANFYPGDVNISVSKNGGAPYAAAPSDWARTGAQGTAEYDIWTGTITIPGPADHSGDGDYVIGMTYTDRSGNAMPDYTSEQLTIDTTKPIVLLSYDNNNAFQIVSGRGYFNASRTATITVTEHNFRADDFAALVTAVDGTLPAAMEVDTIDYTAFLSDRANWNHNGDIHTITVPFDVDEKVDANYDFEFNYSDLALNGNYAANWQDGIALAEGTRAPFVFTIDTAAPTGSIYAGGNWLAAAEETTWTGFLASFQYNLWSNTPVGITIVSADNLNAFHKVEYFRSQEEISLEDAKNKADGWLTADRDSFNFSVNPDEQFIVYARIIDMAGNALYLSSDGIIADLTAPDVEKFSPVITVTPVQQPVNGYYSGDVDVDITVVDTVNNNTYSGLKTITYKVVSLGQETQGDPLFTFDPSAEGATQKGMLTQKWEGKITVSSELNNADGVQIVVYAQDNAKNETTNDQVVINIDTTKPTVYVKYSAIEPDPEYPAFFPDPRTATITVTERHLDKDTVENMISVNGAAAENITLTWGEPVPGTALNGDKTTWTATYKYSDDADYTFAFDCKDLAGNPSEPVVFADKTVSPAAFTVDNTDPAIEVTYGLANGPRTSEPNPTYNTVMTVEVTVTEHNFDPKRVGFTKSGAMGASQVEATQGPWQNDGDTHGAVFTFDADGTYNFAVTQCKDKAGRTAKYTERTFIVDQTLPTLSITKIVNESANKGETIGFEIVAIENYPETMVFKPKLTMKTLKGDIDKTKLLSGPKNVLGGKQYSVSNLTEDAVYTIQCELVDAAGNVCKEVTRLSAPEKTETIQYKDKGTFLIFSVNRNGSTFYIDGYTWEVVREKQYVPKVLQNIQIHEVNVDPLDKYSIRLIKSTDVEYTDLLVEGDEIKGDYTVAKENKNWHENVYDVKKKNFEQETDYTYTIRIKSEDKTARVVFNDVKSIDSMTSFTIDRQKPLVTVSGLEDNGIYNTDTQTVTLVPTDPGGRLNKLEVKVIGADNKPLEGYGVTLDENPLSADPSLLEHLDKHDGKVEFTVPAGSNMTVEITCSDSSFAPNGKSNTFEQTLEKITVSTNPFKRFVANKNIFYPSVGGVALLGVAGLTILLIKKRKSKA